MGNMKAPLTLTVLAALYACGPQVSEKAVTPQAAAETPPEAAPEIVHITAEVMVDVVDEHEGHPAAEPRLNAPFRDPKVNVDTWTSRFEGESREVYRARDSIASSIGLERGDVVADIGTGTGLFVRYLSDAVGAEGQVIAVDISRVFVEHVTARVAQAGLENVKVQLGTSEDPKLPAGQVDVIFVCDTYHHFEDPSGMLSRFKDALKPDGRLIIVDMHRIEGKTSAFWLDHLRAGKEVFEAEIVAAGFRRLVDPPTPFLRENYLMVFGL